jgi:uncharacterized protein YukE
VWTILALLALLAVIVGLIIKTETLGKDYKRIQAQARIIDSDSQQVQQVTFELAETLALTLTSQLHMARRMSRFDEKDLDLFELCLQAIPLVCKEMLNRRPSLSVAFQRSVRQLTDIDPALVEALITRHGRLVQAWQRNSLSGYLQLSQQIVLLVQEYSHKDSTRNAADAQHI